MLIFFCCILHRKAFALKCIHLDKKEVGESGSVLGFFAFFTLLIYGAFYKCILKISCAILKGKRAMV